MAAWCIEIMNFFFISDLKQIHKGPFKNQAMFLSWVGGHKNITIVNSMLQIISKLIAKPEVGGWSKHSKKCTYNVFYLIKYLGFYNLLVLFQYPNHSKSTFEIPSPPLEHSFEVHKILHFQEVFQ